MEGKKICLKSFLLFIYKIENNAEISFFIYKSCVVTFIYNIINSETLFRFKFKFLYIGYFLPYIYYFLIGEKVYKARYFTIYGIFYLIYKMASRTKTREITIVDKGGTFDLFFRRFSGNKEEFDFGGISTLRKLLSNEKARLLHVIKTKNPDSIYKLAKILKRDLKSVNGDVKLLGKFGFIDLISEKTGKRERHRPVLVVDSVNIKLSI